MLQVSPILANARHSLGFAEARIPAGRRDDGGMLGPRYRPLCPATLAFWGNS